MTCRCKATDSIHPAGDYIQSFGLNKKHEAFCFVFFGGAEGNLRSLSRLTAALRSALAFSLAPLWRQKGVPDTFLFALRFPSNQNKRTAFMRFFCFGGAEGNRTPVRKPIHGVFSERSSPLGFPIGYAEEQAYPVGSFISSWKGSKLCPTHVHR